MFEELATKTQALQEITQLFLRRAVVEEPATRPQVI